MHRHSRRDVEAALDIQKRQMKAEFERIQSIADADEREAERVRLEIVDEILTLRCPNPQCGAALQDFSGCFALTCYQCSAGFCGWCVEYWSHDAHGHVPTCARSLSGGHLCAPFELFERAQVLRKKELIVARLARMKKEARRRALRLLDEDLRHVGVNVDRKEIIE
mmetsp:Transcript_7847/g.19475  ORF Transcript_7847/g.19475 Transcript_7847/m.19475 type:complete len:166 (-) Transcript_7847:129-626(-)